MDINPNLDVYGVSVPVWEKGQEGGRSRPIDRDILKRIMIEFVEVLEKHNIKYCISHGTMLGLYRDGNFIPWDDDVDIALLDFSQKQLVEVECRKDLEALGFYMPPCGDPSKPVNGFGNNPNMPYYDTVAIKDGEKIECWWFERKIQNGEAFYIYDEPRSKWDLKHPAKFYDELAEFEWAGKKWKIPNHINEWLVLMYGDGWNRPDPNRKYTNQRFDAKGNLIIRHD